MPRENFNKIFILSFLIYFPVLFLPLILISFFAAMNMIQSTFAGFEIIDLMKISIYIILPVVYIVLLALLVFKLKITLDMRIVLLVALIGFLTMPFVITGLKTFLVPSLTLVSPIGITSSPIIEYNSIFRNLLLINSIYISFVIGYFMTQLIKGVLWKIVVFFTVGFGLSLLILNPITQLIFLLV